MSPDLALQKRARPASGVELLVEAARRKRKAKQEALEAQLAEQAAIGPHAAEAHPEQPAAEQGGAMSAAVLGADAAAEGSTAAALGSSSCSGALCACMQCICVCPGPIESASASE